MIECDHALFLFIKRLSTGSIRYCDFGPLAFASWLGTVLESIVIDAWPACCPLSSKEVLEIDSGHVEEPVAAHVSADDSLDLQTGIDRIEHPKVQKVVSEIQRGKEIGDLAVDLGLSYSYAAELRQRGIAELQRFFAANGDL